MEHLSFNYSSSYNESIMQAVRLWFGIAVLGSLFLVKLSCAMLVPATANIAADEKIYRERCGRCHNLVPPHAYTDGQWRSVIARMQLESGLSDDEARIILKWLQSSN